MKYIEADKLKKIVEQAMQRALKGAEVDRDLYCDGRADAFEEVLLEIDSLQQEQPAEKLDAEIDRFYRSDEYKMSHDLGRGFEAIAYHFFDFGCTRTAEMYDDIEYNRQRAEEAELSGDLEEEIKRMVYDVVYDFDGPAIIGTSEYLSVKDIADIARHFAEWGAEHLKR